MPSISCTVKHLVGEHSARNVHDHHTTCPSGGPYAIYALQTTLISWQAASVKCNTLPTDWWIAWIGNNNNKVFYMTFSCRQQLNWLYNTSDSDSRTRSVRYDTRNPSAINNLKYSRKRWILRIHNSYGKETSTERTKVMVNTNLPSNRYESVDWWIRSLIKSNGTHVAVRFY